MREISPRLWSWASEIEPNTLEQAETLSRLPIVAGHVALMPDAHLGKGSTVGSVIPTKGAVIPAAIGVDIGCGCVAARTSFHADQLPDSLDPFVAAMHRVVPAGLRKWRNAPKPEAYEWWERHRTTVATELTDEQVNTLLIQLGTMGSGNHFFEVALDQEQGVWILMHSGSRGIGNQLARQHIEVAGGECDFDFLALRGDKGDRDLAWLAEGTPEFAAYIADMRFAQDYALKNRAMMMDAALAWFFAWMGSGREIERVNCHHNFTELEDVPGLGPVWVTRKGAIRAGHGDLGLIPGAMGGKSYVIRGRGSAASYESCAHGAGRRMSRTRARKTFSIESLEERMAGTAWQERAAADLLDEHPDSYKDIDLVMADQADLVEILVELRAIANYKGHD